MSKLQTVFSTISNFLHYATAQSLPCSSRSTTLDSFTNGDTKIANNTKLEYFLYTVPQFDGNHELKLSLIGAPFYKDSTHILGIGVPPQYSYKSLSAGIVSKEKAESIIGAFEQGRALQDLGVSFDDSFAQELMRLESAKGITSVSEKKTNSNIVMFPH